MFQGFTPAARRAVANAGEGASRLGLPYKDVELLLLGLVDDDETTPTAATLRGLGVTADAVRARIRQSWHIEPEDEASRRGLRRLLHRRPAARDVPMSDDAKRALEFALRESFSDRQEIITASHLARGVLRAPGGAELFTALGVDPEPLREKLVASAGEGD